MTTNASASVTMLMDMRYHTSGNPLSEIKRPNTPVHPARKTARCSKIKVWTFFSSRFNTDVKFFAKIAKLDPLFSIFAFEN